MFIELAKNASLLLALCFLHGANIRLWRKRPLISQTMSGLLFGGICVIGMLSPVVMAPGVIFDARSVVLSMAGLFGGPVVAGISAAIAMAWRTYLGGAGTGVGIMVILLCSALGLAYRQAHAKGRLDTGPVNLLVFGLLLHLAVFGLFQWLPPEVTQRINQVLTLPFLLVFMLATVAMGLLLRVSYELERTERQVALRGETVQVEAREVDTVEMPVETHRVAPVVAAPARGTSRLNSRVEPTFERIA